MSTNLKKTSRLSRSGIGLMRVMLPLLILLSTFVTSSQAQTADKTLTREQLVQLVAPVALYPDPLLAQVFMASTYPLEIVQAGRWATSNSNLKGKELEDALQKQPWDPSVKSLVAVPDVLKMMNDKLEWTEQLGNAFLAQQNDVMDAVQDLRARADAKGSLKTTPQQKVSKQTTSGGQTTVVIEPADPEVVYVPAYDPGVVYGEWPYPDYPPYAWYPPGYVPGAGLWFGARIAAGAALWAGWNWANHQVNINPLRYNSFNRTNISNPEWKHDVAHRKGVPYNNASVANRFGQKGAGGDAREAFRGRAEAGQRELAKPGQGAGAARPTQRPAETKRPASPQTKQAKGSGSKATQTKAAQAKTSQAKAANRDNVKALDAGRGQNVKRESARGAQSRQAMAAPRPATRSAGGGGGAARVSGGGARGGGSVGRGGGGGGGRRSDVTLKHDIVLLGHLDNGIGLYRFSYNGSDKSYVGVLAQDVQTIMPNAVVRGSDGYLRVFYDKVGVKFQSYERWLRTGARVRTELPAVRSPTLASPLAGTW